MYCLKLLVYQFALLFHHIAQYNYCTGVCYNVGSTCLCRIPLALILDQLPISVYQAVMLTMRKRKKQNQVRLSSRLKLGFLLESQVENILPYIANGNGFDRFY